MFDSSPPSKRTKLDSREGKLADSSAGIARGSMLLTLPVELFERIEDELLLGSRLITKEDILCKCPVVDKDSFNPRMDILLPLAQTCHLLRKLYLPRVYEHVEVWINRGGVHRRLRYLDARLEMTCSLLTQEDGLAKLVHVFTISLTRRSAETILPAFADCLSRLPSLHTLNVCSIEAPISMGPALQDAFEGKRYHQIRTVILPADCSQILRACPNVTEVVCNDWHSKSLLHAIKEDCRHVEVLEGFDFSSSEWQGISQLAPKLRKVVLDVSRRSSLEGYGKVACLSELVLRRKMHSFSKSNKYWIDQGTALLRTSDIQMLKTLTIIWLVPDAERGTGYQHEPFKAYHTITIMV